MSDGPRLAVIGAGANIWGWHHNGIEHAGFQVVAVQDRDLDKVRALGDSLGCPATDSLDELLSVDSDAVAVLAPHRVHAELVEAALTSNRHVLVEKPIAVTPREATRMNDAARARRRVLAVCFQQRTRTEVLAARHVIRSGAIGTVQNVDLVGRWPRRTSYFDTAPWRATWAGEGGGILINQGQHDLDLLTFLVGSPARLTAVLRNAIHPTETEDTASALLEWENGFLGTVHLTSAEFGPPQRIEVVGTRGRLEITPKRLRHWESPEDFTTHAAGDGDPYVAPDQVERPEVTGSGGRHEEIYADFRAALEGDTEPIASGDDAQVTLELSSAILVSGHERVPVEVPVSPSRHSELLERLAADSEKV